MVLKIVIMFQNQMGSHLILLCINAKTHAQTINRIIRFLIFGLEIINKYKIGNKPQIRADIKIRQFWLDESIQK